MSQGITVRHCSLYDVPRAGINIGDGCWGGHVIEFCDIFDTVKETGDHGSFNSWGRDRFWGLDGLNLNDDKAWEAEKDVPLLDAVKTVVLRDNRWRCDHGWDIDLDDGSSNYHIYNNLCLHGGLKNREGFHRVVENNIIVNNGFHPHVWFKHSQDVVPAQHHLVRRLPAGRRHALDAVGPGDGLQPRPPAGRRRAKAGRQAGPRSRSATRTPSSPTRCSSIRPAATSGSRNSRRRLQLGFVNFPMDQFGVQKPELKAIARTPQMPDLGASRRRGRRQADAQSPALRVAGPGPRHLGPRRPVCVLDLPGEYGVLLEKVSAGSPAARAGLQKDDVILACNGKPVRTVEDLGQARDEAAGKKLTLSAMRKQQLLSFDVNDYAFVATEYQSSPDFKAIPLAPAKAVLRAKVTASEPGTKNESLSVLTDGKLAKSYGPVFGNGVVAGKYKLDLGAARSIAQVRTFSTTRAATAAGSGLCSTAAAPCPTPAGTSRTCVGSARSSTSTRAKFLRPTSSPPASVRATANRWVAIAGWSGPSGRSMRPPGARIPRSRSSR